MKTFGGIWLKEKRKYIEPLTPELRGQINAGIDEREKKLSNCESNAFVNAERIGLQAMRDLINALPDGYPIPLERE